MAITTVNSYLTASGLNFREGTTGKASLLLDPSTDKVNLSGNFNVDAGSLTIGGNPIVTGSSSSEGDTLQSVTNRGATTTNSIAVGSTLSVGDTLFLDNNEIWAKNSNNLNVKADGVIRIQPQSYGTAATFATNGNVGIGTTNPNSKLEIWGNGIKVRASTVDAVLNLSAADSLVNNSIIAFGDNNDSNAGQIKYAHDGDSLRFITANTEAVRIDSSQRVGIGTTSVLGSLQVNGRALVEGPSVPTTLTVSDSGDATKAIRIGYEPTWDVGSISASDFGAGWKNIVIAPHAGKVGIGTTSPHQALSVKGTIVAYNTSYVQVAGMTNSSNAGRLYANNAGGVSKVLLDSNGVSYLDGGNVGIGTTGPATTLDVDGLISSDQIRSKKYTSLSGSSNDWFPIGTINEHQTGPVLFQVITAYHSNMSFIVAKGYAPSQEHSITLLSSIDSNNTGYANIKGVRVRQDGQVEIQLYWASGPSVVVNVTARSTTDPVSLPSSLATSTSSENVVDTVTNEDGKLRSRKLITTSSNVQLSDNGISYLNGGNVGIGTTNPARNLSVASSSTNALIQLANSTTTYAADNGLEIFISDTNAGIVNRENGYLRFDTNNTERVRIAAGGSVGIGTTNPHSLLEVSNNSDDATLIVSNKTNGANGAYLRLLEAGTAFDTYGYLGGYIQYDGNNNLINIGRHNVNGTTFSDDVPAISIKRSDGKVGIGVTDPDATLEVKGAGNTNATTSFVVRDSDDAVLLKARNDGVVTVEHGYFYVSASAGAYVQNNFRVRGSLFNDQGTLQIGNSSGTAFDGDVNFDSNTLFVDSSTNRIGIGTTNPQEELDLRGDMRLDSAGNTDRSIYFRNQSSIAKVRSDAALQFDVGVSSSPSAAMYIEEDTRNVGIGTTDPAKKLSVYEAGNAQVQITGTNVAILTISDPNSHGQLNTYNDGTFRINSVADAGGKQLVLSGSNVGVGTANPTAQLHVHGSAGALRIHSSAGGANVYLESQAGNLSRVRWNGLSNFAIRDDNDNADRLVVTTDGDIVANDSKKFKATTYTSSYLSFADDTTLSANSDIIFDVNGSTELMRLEEGGNVGIGTTNPQELLHIDGSSPRIRLRDSDAAGTPYAHIDASDGALLIEADKGDETASSYIALTVDGSESIRAIAGGNVGIGTTDPNGPLHVRYSDSTARASVINNTTVGLKVENSNSAGVAQIHLRAGDGDAHILVTDEGSNATDMFFSVDGTEPAMTIKNNGDIGIGDTSPAAKLELRTTSSTTNGVALRGESNTGAYFRLYHGGEIDTDGNITAARFIQDTSVGNNFYAIQLSRSSLNDSNPDIYGSDNGLVLGANASEDVLKLDTGNTVLVRGGSDPDTNDYKADFAVGVGTNPQISWRNQQVQIGGTDMNYNGNISYDGVFRMRTWNSNISFECKGGSGAGIRDIIFRPFNDTSDTEAMRIKGNGNVGIGTNSPDQSLEVNIGSVSSNESVSENQGVKVVADAGGSIGYAGYLMDLDNSTADASAFMRLSRTAGTAFLGLDIGSQSTDGIRFSTHATNNFNNLDEAMRITADGNVGIGTTDPATKLSVFSGDISAHNFNGTSRVIVSEDGSTTWNSLVMESDGASNNTHFYTDGTSNAMSINSKGATSDIVLSARQHISFKTNNGGTLGGGGERMRITSAGNVGIGTTNPTTTFHVDGNVVFSESGDHMRLRLVADASDQAIIYFGDPANNYQGRVAYQNSNDSLYFYTAGAEKMRILSGGNVGIGTASPSKPLHVIGDIKSSAGIIASRAEISSDVRHAGDENTKMSFDTDTIHLETNGSKRLTVDSAGNIGIGTSGPSAELDVNGEIRAESSMTLGADGTYGTSYGAIGIGTTNLTNGHHRIFAKSSDHMYFAASTSKGFRFRPNGGATSASAGVTIASDGDVGIGTTAPSSKLEVQGTIQTQVYAIGSLPSASPAGQRAMVNDASSSFSYYTLGQTVGGGGSYVAPVYSDGSYWRYG